MKTPVTINANFIAIYDEAGCQSPGCELVLVLGETTYAADESGTLIQKKEFTSIRFEAQPSLMRKMAATLRELADDCEETHAKSLALHTKGNT